MPCVLDLGIHSSRSGPKSVFKTYANIGVHARKIIQSVFFEVEMRMQFRYANVSSSFLLHYSQNVATMGFSLLSSSCVILCFLKAHVLKYSWTL